MGKTNKDQALDILVAHSRQADFIGNDPYVTVDCIGIQREITAALDEVEKHGARKAHAKAILENCYLTDEAELVCKPQPEPQRYTIEEAVRLANELSHAVFVYAGYSSDKNNREITKATEAIVQAITGQPKPAPQLDADKVYGLIDAYGSAERKLGSASPYCISQLCNEMREDVADKRAALLAALDMDI